MYIACNLIERRFRLAETLLCRRRLLCDQLALLSGTLKKRKKEKKGGRWPIELLKSILF